MTANTRANITAEITSLLADNHSEAITPALLRQVVNDINDSAFNPQSDSFNGANLPPITATGASVPRTASDHFGDVYYAKDFGAKCDVHVIAKVGVTSGSNTITSTQFVASDAGKTIVLKSVGTNATQAIGNNGTISRNITSVIPGASAVIDGVAPVYSVAATNAFIGGTDDTTAINAAMAYINTQGGGKLMLTGATIASQITLYRNCCLAGEHEGATWLFQKTGTNADFITTENFAALVGNNIRYGDDARVPSWFGIMDLYIDCQSTQDGRTVGNTAGRGVCLYGNAPYMERVYIMNCAGDGLFTEGASSNVFTLYDYRAIEEGYFNRIETRNCGGNGWTFHGQNDSRLGKVVSSSNLGWNFYSDANYASGFTYNGACFIENLHSYFAINGTGVRIGSNVQISNLYIDYCNLQFDTYAFGSIIGCILFIGAGYKSLNPCIFNATNITIGSIIGTCASTAAAGMKFLDMDGSSDNNIGGSLIDLSGAPLSCTALSMIGGTFNNVNLTVSGLNPTSPVLHDAVNFNGSYNNVNVIGQYVSRGIIYSGGGYNSMKFLGTLATTGTPLAFSGTLASTDTLEVACSTNSNSPNGLSVGTAFYADTIHGNVVIGAAAITNSATGGFLYVPSCPGVPTGTPTVSISGLVPLVIDSGTKALYAYIGGSWSAL